MKKFISIFAAVLMCFVMFPVELSASAVTNYAKGFNGDTSLSVMLDNKGIFSDQPTYRDELDSLIKQTSEKLQMNIMIYVSGSYLSDSATEIFADDTYDEWFGEDTDGVFYYLDLSGKSPAYDYISTSGKAVLMYQNHINSIFSALDNYLPKSGQSYTATDIYNAIKAFLRQLESYSNSTPGFLSYYHDVSSGKYFYYKGSELIVTKSKPPALLLKIGIVSALIGGLVGVICYFVSKGKYKFKNSCNPNAYVSHEETRYSERSDTLIRTYVTKHKIQSSSGGGRSGGGHSHSGGHGGGGHHR